MSEYSAQYGDISAVPCDRENTGPAMADWSVTRANGEKIGWITDARADNGSEPSEIMPENENAAPYEAFAKSGRYITSTHSLRGAIAAVSHKGRIIPSSRLA